MAGFTVVIPVEPGWSQTFTSRDSVVGRNLSDRATRVQLAAKAQVRVYRGAKPGEDPAKRPIPGRLKQDIVKHWIQTPNGDLAISVGSTLPYAELIHEGSPPHVILPRNPSGVLRFVGRDGRVHFSKRVNHPGFEADRYLTDNLPLAVQ
jgi:hypothetical protein